ncbi:MAG TPA: hypothetical protein VH025_01390 [Solirubrobacteraceae bacterium]|jgi:DNA/RNA-binding domain of Phe-tRNA-synthetase-like protein|nr:hypothetical protein [Solirubrobacteraceae bacterium]
MSSDPAFGWIAQEIAEELPELRLLSCEVDVARRGSLRGRSPADIEERMRTLSNGFRGPRAIAIRREPVPAAYRAFFRQIGLDPDIHRTPIEAIVAERMLHGGFPSSGMLDDILLIALIDTGVPVWALDAETLEGEIGIRPSRQGELLGAEPGGAPLPAGRLVVADGSVACAVLFQRPAEARAPRAGSRALKVFTVQVAGVPQLYAEEALWNACAALELP